MALQKQQLSLPMTQGLNTKVDDKQAPLGTLEILENVVFDTPGEYRKRTGYEAIDLETIDNLTINMPQKITTFKEELCVYNSTNFYSYSESIQKWSNKGTISNIFPSSSTVVRNSYQQSAAVCQHIDNIDAFAWQDTRGGIRISVIDHETGNEIISDREISSTGILPKISKIGNIFYFIYIEGTSLYYRTVKANNPSSISLATTIISADLHTIDKLYDSLSISNRICIAYHSAAATLKLLYILPNGNFSAISEFVSESPSKAIDLNSDADFRIAVTYYDGTNVKFTLKNFNLTASIINPTVIETISNVVNVTALTIDNIIYEICYEISAPETYNHYIKSNTITANAIVGTPQVFIRSCGLASKIFVQDNNLYVAVLHNSTEQSTYFILNNFGEVVSKIAPLIGGALWTGKTLPKIIEINKNNFLFAHQTKGRTTSEQNILFSLLGISKTILDFDNPVKYDNATLGENLHTTGGIIQSYDGKEIVEHGFHIYPENLEAVSTSSSGGFMSDGTYQYSAIYSWIDNKGYQHRSAPSQPLQVVLSAGTTTQQQTIKIPTLRITEKSNVIIEIYRTEGAGTVPYKITSSTSPLYNNPAVDSLNFIDTISDTDLISNEVLYTASDELENIAPPAASIIETFQNRIFLAGLEDFNQIQYSKLREQGKPVEFNDTLNIVINPIGGVIKALAAMDDKLIIFKEQAIFFITGNGPNNQGEQDNFIEPELISSDVGCIDQNSVVLTPEGLMFKSVKGIFLLNKTLSTSYIGAPVESYNNLTINSATFVPSKNQVIFITNGDALVYNYFSQQWATFTNHKGISSTTLDNTLYYVRNDNQIYKSNNSYTDNGSFIPIKIETSWMSFGGIQGYQRVYRALLLGTYISKHKLTMEIAYNYLPAYVESKTIDASDFTADSIYGQSSPYGFESPYGGIGNQYQFRLDFGKQKCQSIRIRITESQDSNYGEGLQISNINFIVGAKTSEFKPSQARIYGSIKGI